MGQKESGVTIQGDLFRSGTIHMKYSLPGQEKDDLFIQVIVWTGLTKDDLLIQVIVWTDLTVKCI